MKLSPFFLSLFIILAGCQKKEVALPGALRALQLQTAQRAYPHELPPAEAHFGAMKQFSAFQNSTRTDIDDHLWESIGPWNTSGRTLSLAVHPSHPSTIWAGSASGGLWRTQEFGADTSWRKVETGFPVQAVGTVAISPLEDSVIYLGTGEVYNLRRSGDGQAYRSTRGNPGIGILKSSDQGRTWSLSLDWRRDQNTGVQHIEVSSRNKNFVVAATTEGVLISNDAGETWQNTLDVPMVTDVGIDPFSDDRILAVCGNFNSSRKGIYYSVDGGESWSLATGDIPNFNGKGRLDWSRSKEGVAYASIGEGFSTGGRTATWTLKTTDGGKTWDEVSTVDYSRWQGWFAHDIAVHPTSPDTIIGVGIYIHKSEMSGSQFEQITRTPQVTLGRPPVPGPDGPIHYTHVDHHNVIYHPVHHDTVLAASDGGVFISKDGGETWESRNGGMQTTQFYNGTSVSNQDSSFFLGGLQDNTTVIFDGEYAWTRTLGGDGSYTGMDQNNNANVFASFQFLNIFKSTAYGQNWQRIYSPAGDDRSVFIAPYYIHPEVTQVMYAASNFVYFSEDQGQNWNRTNGGNALDGNNPVYSLGLSPSDVFVVYAGTAPFDGTPKLFLTKDAGATWDEVGQGQLPNRYPVDIAVDPEDPARAIVVYSGYGSGHVFVTADFGETWTDITGNLPDVPTNAVALDDNHKNVIYVGNDFGVFYTEDGGKSWDWLDNGIPEAVVVSDLQISTETNMIFAATHGNGVYRSELIDPETTSLSDEESVRVKVFPSIIGDDRRIHLEGLESLSSIDYQLVSLQGQVIQNGQVPDGRKSVIILGESTSYTGPVYLQLTDERKKVILNQLLILQ